MASVIEMPKLSDTMEEGGVAQWLVKEGEFVEEGGPLVEIETDKATMEYQSPEEGTLLKILAEQGTTCLLNAPICILGEKGEKYDENALLGSKEAPPVEDNAAKTTPASSSQEVDEASAKSNKPHSGNKVSLPKPPVHDKAQRLRSSPLARKIAKEKGLDINEISGSGPAGRVILRDIKAWGKGPTPHETAATSPREPAKNADKKPPLPPSPDGSKGLKIPLTMMRKTIAKRLTSAKNEAPHFYLTVSADMTRLLKWRQRLNADKKLEKAQKVSVNDLIVMASAKALTQHQEINASFQGDSIYRHGEIHVAVAVALEEGLVTPVIRNTNQLGVRQIAAESKRLVGLAKAGSLTADDYTSGTFTISNLGMMGVEEFTAIINPPQAAILACGATIKTPTVSDQDEISICPRMKMTLSCDHRVVDGAMGAAFLQTLVRYLEDPLMVLV